MKCIVHLSPSVYTCCRGNFRLRCANAKVCRSLWRWLGKTAAVLRSDPLDSIQNEPRPVHCCLGIVQKALTQIGASLLSSDDGHFVFRITQWSRRQAKHMKSWYILDSHILRCTRRLLVSHHCAWWRNNRRKRRAQKPSYRAGECCANFYTMIPVSESPFQKNPSIDWPMVATLLLYDIGAHHRLHTVAVDPYNSRWSSISGWEHSVL